MVISTLTAEHRRRIPEFQEKWHAIARQPNHTDEAPLKAVIRRVYELSGLTMPPLLVTGDPFSAIAGGQPCARVAVN